eukprot:9320648-Karenia_brevis.AAC.1
MDGYEAVVLLSQRIDVKTSASLLSSFLDVVSPPSLKGSKDLASGVQDWESKVTPLRSRYDEDIKGKLKLAMIGQYVAKGLSRGDFKDRE